MIQIPTEFIAPLIKILQWHLGAYMPEIIFNTRVERILDTLHKATTTNFDALIEEKEVYYIRECASNATNNIAACGVEKDLVWKIHDWAFAEYQKTK